METGLDNNLFCPLNVPFHIERLSQLPDAEQIIQINASNDRLLSFVNIQTSSDAFKDNDLRQVSIQLSVMIDMLSKILPSENGKNRQEIELYSNRVSFYSDKEYVKNTLCLLSFPIIDTLPLTLTLPVNIQKGLQKNHYIAHILAVEDMVLEKLDKWIFIQNRKKIAERNNKI